jgi:small subunit ribosomal protein S15
MLVGVCSASYKNKENIDLAKVPALAKHENDVGSTEVQVARLSARVEQISSHLKNNRKDFSGQRGLQQVLNQRRKLLQYLHKTDRCAQDTVCAGERWEGLEGRQGWRP